MTFDKILTNLYVGACPLDHVDVDRLRREAGITAVLSVQTEEDFAYWRINWESLAAYYEQTGVTVRRVPVQDFNLDDLARRLPECVAALDQLVKDGHTVYVHCSAGINRSPTVVIAWLHWIEQWPLADAKRHVMTCRASEPCMEAIRLAEPPASPRHNSGSGRGQ